VKMIISVVVSLFVPGLGQLFHGKFLAGVLFFVAAIFTGPAMNLVAAAHCLFLSGK